MTNSFRLLLVVTALFIAVQLAALGLAPAMPGVGFSVRSTAAGVVINHVRAGSSAQRAGLQKGQQLLTLEETAIRQPYDLHRWLSQFAHAGIIADATVIDHGTTRRLRFTVEALHPGMLWWIIAFSLALYYFSGYYLLRVCWSNLTARWFGFAMMGIGLIDGEPFLHALWAGWLNSVALGLETTEAKFVWLAPALLMGLLWPAVAFCVFQFMRRQHDVKLPLDWFDRFLLGLMAADAATGFFAYANRSWGWTGPRLEQTYEALTGTVFVLIIFLAMRLGRRMRGQIVLSPGVVRQYRLLRAGALIAFVPALPSPFVHLLWPGSRLDHIAGLSSLSAGLFPILTAYAISRYRLFGLQRIMRKSLQYGLLSGGIGVLFLALLIAVIWRAQHDAGHPAFAADMFLLAGLIVTSRWGSPKLHRVLDRRFFREAWTAEDILSRLGSQLGHFFQIDELQRYVLTQMDAALHFDWGAFYASTGEGVGRKREVMAHSLPTQLPELLHPGHDAETMQTPLVIENRDDDRHAWQHWAGAEVVIPLRYQERLRGWLLLGPKRSQEPYSRRDLKLLDAIGSQLAAAIAGIHLLEEVRKRDRIQQEIDLAREVQMRLLPQHLPQIPEVAIAAAYSPAREVGGDYYDAVEITPGVLTLTLADVSGKGVSAALLMANLQAVVHGQMHSGTVSQRLAHMNSQLCHSVLPGQYVTMFYCEYDSRQRTLTYSNAGHEPPLLLRHLPSAGAEAARALNEGGTVLGLFAGIPYASETILLEPNDLLILYTDGVTDAINPEGERFERERLVQVASDLARQNLSAAAIVEQIRRQVSDFSSGQAQFDDLTLLALKVGPE